MESAGGDGTDADDTGAGAPAPDGGSGPVPGAGDGDGGTEGAGDADRDGLAVWRRVAGLSWPVGVEHTTRTLMRTTDVVVTGLFSPAAIAAVGLADLYARFPLRIGLGLGGGAIALSSQDTGAGAAATRDEAVTAALLLGVLAGLPFVVVGLTVGELLVAALGASPEVTRLGGTYLAVVFATAPARHVALVAARSLQGTGDTRTPMYVNIVANVANAAGSATLGLGLFGAPRLGILGVGLATAAANVGSALAFLAVLASARSDAGLRRPAETVVVRQLVAVSTPKVAEGVAATLVDFPFNALLLGLGTEVNAAWQVGRRAYQQVTAPFSRGFNVAANVVVGQALGAGDPDRARFEARATAALALTVVGALGAGLFLGAPAVVSVFVSDPLTAGYAAEFTRLYGLVAPALVFALVLSGALQGASETRVPFYARTSAGVLFRVGLAYLLVWAGWGVDGVYVGLAVSFLWLALVNWAGFRYGDWAGRAARMMAERGTGPGAGGEGDAGEGADVEADPGD